jgi:nitrogen fixation/metabolism regulation signal transduction histidine kinase
MVFDDITEVVSAQRSAAWAEVARRLAHEIKNPLTPIQLSAERLQHKLGPSWRAPTSAADALGAHHRRQVQAMQRLVNEFRDYARLPAAQLKPLDLNALATEVLALYGQAAGQRAAGARLEPEACRASWATPRSCGRSSTTWCRTAWMRWPTGPTARSS